MFKPQVFLHSLALERFSLKNQRIFRQLKDFEKTHAQNLICIYETGQCPESFKIKYVLYDNREFAV